MDLLEQRRFDDIRDVLWATLDASRHTSSDVPSSSVIGQVIRHFVEACLHPNDLSTICLLLRSGANPNANHYHGGPLHFLATQYRRWLVIDDTLIGNPNTLARILYTTILINPVAFVLRCRWTMNKTNSNIIVDVNSDATTASMGKLWSSNCLKMCC